MIGIPLKILHSASMLAFPTFCSHVDPIILAAFWHRHRLFSNTVHVYFGVHGQRYSNIDHVVGWITGTTLQTSALWQQSILKDCQLCYVHEHDDCIGLDVNLPMASYIESVTKRFLDNQTANFRLRRLSSNHASGVLALHKSLAIIRSDQYQGAAYRVWQEHVRKLAARNCWRVKTIRALELSLGWECATERFKLEGGWLGRYN